MCRIVAFSCNEDVEIQPFLEYLIYLSEHGKNNPHHDGWGYFGLNSEGLLSVVRSKNPITEDKPKSNFKAKVFIGHVRKASPGTDTTYDQAHPLLHLKDARLTALVHNGLLRDAKKIFLNLDTEDILLEISKNGIYDGIERLLKRDFKSLNMVLYKEGFVYALRLAKEKLDYYTLYYKETKNMIFLCSEEIEDEMIPLKNGTMLKVKDGTIMERKHWNFD